MGKSIQHSLILGFALFALYFGAGNLIFPPTIGLASGTGWVPAMVGFSVTGIVLPLLAVLAVLNAGGKFENLTRPIAPWFHVVFNLLLMVGIGVFVTIPRMAATTHELGTGVLLPSLPPVVTILLFFAVTFFFAMDKSNVIDRIGKYLTPVLVVILLIIVGKGFLSPIGSPAGAHVDNPFSMAFLSAYQTGDVVTGILCAPIFIAAIAGYGYTGRKARKMAVSGVLIAGAGLLIIYGGLLVISAGAGGTIEAGLSDTALVKAIVDRLLGGGGAVALAIAIALACLTSTIGVIAVIADFLAKLAKDRLSYRTWVLLICVVSASVATLGVGRIVDYTMWIFTLLYPVAIVLVLLGVLDRFIPNGGVYQGAIILTVAVSFMETLKGFGVGLPVIDPILAVLPFGDDGFAWLVPAIVGAAAGYAVHRYLPGSRVAGLDELKKA
ncbi:branched-chain amino acid transport system II carrier protein [Bhargavaea ullalensis]|uniref:Branched-chain amino acid transport system carrier protein n=1 Tax=Bhargavaea ullalensis TaxID=1265685 RepID=A0ABV2G9V2_9BACL